MSHAQTLTSLRAKYKRLVGERKFEEAVDVLTEVGAVYYKMHLDKQPVPVHFLDPGDPLL